MFADAITAIKDIIDRLQKNDNDAAAFYTISATFYLVGGGLTILSLPSEYIWINPWIIFALVAIGFLSSSLATFFTDSDIETFIKQTVLYEDITNKLSGEPYEQIQKLSSIRNQKQGF